MDYAKERRGGVVVRNWQTSLEDAKTRDFVCADCRGHPARMDVAAMPGLAKVTSHRRADPRFAEFYFRTAKLQKHRDCILEEARVAQVVGERVIRSRSGAPGEPPVEIRFDRRLARVGGDIAEGDREAAGPLLRRHVDGEEQVRERGPRATVATTIAPACMAYVRSSFLRSSPLRVPGLPEDATTYEKVFRSMEEPLPGQTRIWFAKLQFAVPPEQVGTELRIATYGGIVVIDRVNWGGAAAIRAFDAELAILLDHSRNAWKRGVPSPSPMIYVLEEFGVGEDAIRVDERRRVCVLVRDPG